ncbi:MAG: hypothetical protein H6839_07230 [Planctomycetes bacterium]|nr:hypothetical protein [Planctomycetota bacterium]
MGCEDDAIIEVFGDWIPKTQQAPPNASQADRNAAQSSANSAADGAADNHCSSGQCQNQNKVCSGTRVTTPHRSYTFEDGAFAGTFYIRCKVVGRYHCECKDRQAQKNEGKRQQKKPTQKKTAKKRG